MTWPNSQTRQLPASCPMGLLRGGAANDGQRVELAEQGRQGESMANVNRLDAPRPWRCATVLLLASAWLALAAGTTHAQGPGRPDFDDDGFNDLPVGVPLEGHSGKSSAGAVDVIMGAGLNAGAVPGLTKKGAQHWTLADIYVGQMPESGDLFGFALAAGDFNGDFASDLAIGIPGRKVGRHANAGAVAVLYGATFTGLVANPRWSGVWSGQYFVQGEAGILGAPGPDERFGHALVTGDFNGDGFDDLAVGAPGGVPFLVGPQGRGEVNVIYGSSSGLHPSLAAANQLWNQQPLLDDPEPGDWFGFSLASGQWGHGDEDDLAIGAPGETIGGVERAGVVNVVYGSPTGLGAASNELFDASDFPPEANVFFPFGSDKPQMNAHFGFSLAGGHLERAGYFNTPDALVIGEPFRDVTDSDDSLVKDAGAVRVLHGADDGLSGEFLSDSQTWRQGFAIGQLPEEGDYFGYAVWVAGGDLAVGAPGEDLQSSQSTLALNAGIVYVRFEGPNDTVDKWLMQSLPSGVTGEARFGSSLSYGKYACGKGSCAMSLIVGAPGSLNLGGVVSLFAYDDDGYPAIVQQDVGEAWWQDVIFGAEPSEAGDLFGLSLGAGGLPWFLP